jgi:pimeloyl-ACP methyl ester carboxylesterase
MTRGSQAGDGRTGAAPGATIALLCGAVAAIPILLLVALLPSTPITLLGAAYLTASVLGVVALLTLPWRRHRLRWLGRLACGSIVIIAGLRIAAQPGAATLRVVTGPGIGGPRWANLLFDEQDIVLFGERVAARLGLVSPREDAGLVHALALGYTAMRADGATTRSPFLNTALGQQTPGSFDLLIAEPPSASPARVAVIFLHGYGGNFALQCWLVARPALRVGATTVCPSTGVRGDWWSASGETIVRRTIAMLRERGAQRIYLAGISNGAVGVSHLAPALQDHLAGIILISGADPDVPPPPLPTLVLHGAQDERMPVGLVAQYAAAAGDRASAHIADGDHFLLLKRADAMQAILADWLARQEAAGDT